jgi:acetone carboxylase gamma subunit
MRLARITPHDMRDDAEIRAYACDCGHEVVQMVRLWPLKAVALPAP